MNEFSVLQITTLIATAAVFFFKTFHFVQKFRRKKIIRWVYFDLNNIMSSRSAERAKAKRMQNVLSLVLLALGILSLVLLLL
jgi:hypothetical protein